MSNSSNKFTKLALIGALALTLSPLAGGGVSADTQHPHPTYKDTWNYGKCKRLCQIKLWLGKFRSYKTLVMDSSKVILFLV